MTTDTKKLKQEFLLEALKELPFAEWDEHLCLEVEKKLKMQKHQHALLFPAGVKDLVALYEEYADSKMLAKLKSLKSATKIRDKVKYGVYYRLDNGIPHSKLIHQKTANYYKKLNNLNLGMVAAWRTVDLIWKFAGDTATDFNYYTKRGLLFGVYSATLMFYLNDDSKDHAATWRFLDKRINNALKLGSLKNSLDISKLCANLPFIRQFRKYHD